jgi:glycerophosphoryl diester phosphodiesterase
VSNSGARGFGFLAEAEPRALRTGADRLPSRAMSRLLSLAALAALFLLAPASSALAQNPWLAERVLNFAHQGGEDEFPSNTLFAYKESLKHGADLLEIDVGVTKDGKLVVLHDNKVDRTTNGTGSITDMTLAEVQKLDAAYWYAKDRGTRRDAAASAYVYRGIRTGAKKPPKGYAPGDFAIPSLDQVLREFPRTGMNIEIKGRDGDDAAVYQRGAELLAATLKKTNRKDIIVASFEQPAIDTFHRLAPKIGVAPGIDGTASFVLSNGSPGPGVAAFQVPITFKFGDQLLTITTPDFVARAHEGGYAVHTWLSNDREDDATYRKLLGMCVDGIMAAKPKRLEKVLAKYTSDPCGTKVAKASLSASGSSVTVPLDRVGASMEKRSGQVRLVRAGKTVGTGTWSLDSAAKDTTARVRLKAGTGKGSVRAEVLERGRRVSARSVTLR